MKRLLYLLALFLSISISSCKTSKIVNRSDFRDSTKTTKIIVKERIIHDTIVHEKFVTKQDSNLLCKIDSNNIMIDSLQLTNSLKDKRILELVQQIASNRLYLEPITVEEDYAIAKAGITNNRLWLNLWQKNVISDVVVTDTTTTIETNVVSDSKHTEQIVKSMPTIRNVWFWISIIFGIIAIFSLRLAIKRS